MAKKKVNNSINLLKGIQGSKLAVLVTVILILIAIPLTVTISQQQQNTKQEAGYNPCGPCYIYYAKTDSCRYKCTGNQKCTPSGCKAPTPTPIKKKACSSVGGNCVSNTSTKYCSVTISSGTCSGGKVCCQPGSYLPRN